MRFSQSVLYTILAAVSAYAAYVPTEPWSTLTPSQPAPSSATDNFPSTFGIAIYTLSGPSSVPSGAIVHFGKRAEAIQQIQDGQVQVHSSSSTKHPLVTVEAVSQIKDGQVQATTGTSTSSTTNAKNTVHAISQIDDGQIQAPTATPSTTTKPTPVVAISQIGDGQIQAPTDTNSAVNAVAISQIADGQIQATTGKFTPTTFVTADAISQIADGQVQATGKPTSAKQTVQVISQISDGQIQASFTDASSKVYVTKVPISQISDGQIQATFSVSSSVAVASAVVQLTDGQTINQGDSGVDISQIACKNNGTLQVVLDHGVLYDARKSIGSVVANHQIQFDGPVPQAGAIYAGGWSILPNSTLALGSQVIFYQCRSGTFYNLYDYHIGSECYPIELQAVSLTNCI